MLLFKQTISIYYNCPNFRFPTDYQIQADGAALDHITEFRDRTIKYQGDWVTCLKPQSWLEGELVMGEQW